MEGVEEEVPEEDPTSTLLLLLHLLYDELPV